MRSVTAFSVVVLAALVAGCQPTADSFSVEGLTLYNSGDYASAVAAFQEAAALQPQKASHHFNLAAARQAQGQLEQAILSYNTAVRLEPGMMRAHENIARCFLAMDDHERAAAAYKRAGKLNPLSAIPFYNFALYHLEQGNDEQAELWLRKAVAHNPDDARAHGLLGEFLIDSGRRDEGIRHYRKSLELQPLNVTVAKRQYEMVERNRLPAAQHPNPAE